VTAQEQPADPTEEISISAQHQTALDNEALTVSETPDVGPHQDHLAAIVGLGPMIAPVYLGSKKSKVSPFPYVDIRGLLDDRVFISDVVGLGVKILNDGPVRAGVAVGYYASRTSSDDPRLKGLPDIKGAARVTSYLGYSFKPFALEARIQQRLGSGSGTSASIGASYAVAPLPQLHLTFSGDVTWANATYQKVFYGITPAEAASASAEGNPLPAYLPGAGLTDASLTATGVYQLGRHWGLATRLSFHDIVGSPVKDSPLTQRTFAPSIALGALYMF
jgi:outer membrane scaffolding protein for murein synthesis (MipA/OmpV family)